MPGKMETNNTLQKKGRERTTNEQLRYFVTFCKKHPQLQAGKNSTLSPRAMQNLWDQVSKDLNGIRGPSRTASEWKRSLSHWKYLLLSRVRKAKAEMNMTSGGLQSNKISAFEEQAVQALDIEGDMSFEFRQMRADNKIAQLPADSESSLSQSSLSSSSSLLMVASPSDSDGDSTSPSDIQPPTPISRAKPKENGTDQLLQITLDKIMAQNLRDERTVASNLSLQKTMINSIAILTKAMVTNASSTITKAQTSSSHSEPMDEWDKTALSLAEYMRNAANEFPHLADRFRVQLLEVSLDVQKQKVNARAEEST